MRVDDAGRQELARRVNHGRARWYRDAKPYRFDLPVAYEDRAALDRRPCRSEYRDVLHDKRWD
jgi:hypothetical protein